MADRPIILVFVATYLPGYKAGGPVRTIANMVEHLGGEFDFRIVTADRDATDTCPYPDVVPDIWHSVGRARVLYVTPQNRSLAAIVKLVRETQHDLLYVNSFFSPTFATKPLLAWHLQGASRRPIVVAPRGEFSEGALEIKRWKKMPYVRVSRLLGFHRGVTWQASSEYEKMDIFRVMAPAPGNILIGPNLPGLTLPAPSLAKRTRRKGDPLRVCFLSRISPKKNLDFALRTLAQVSVPVEFNIYGPVDDASYWSLCQKLIGKLGTNAVARSHGPVSPAEVQAIMAEHDLFFLPTRGENYGHVIAEALSAGTPVLIAETTPWRGLEAVRVGWDLPLNSEADFARRIEYCAGLGGAEYADMRDRVSAYAAERLGDPALVEANRSLFLDVMQHAPAGRH